MSIHYQSTRINIYKVFSYDFKLGNAGIYLIGNFYVGASKNLKQRLTNHFTSSRNDSRGNNQELADLIALYNSYDKKPIPVRLLSENLTEEYYWISKLKYLGFPLVNKAIDTIPKNQLPPQIDAFIEARNDINSIEFYDWKGL